MLRTYFITTFILMAALMAALLGCSDRNRSPGNVADDVTVAPIEVDSAENTAVHTRQPPTPVLTPTPTIIPSPTPTQLFELFENEIAPIPRPAAFVEGNDLYLLEWGVNKTPMVVDGCPPRMADCAFRWLRWSPTGKHLLYSIAFTNGEGEYRQALRMVNWQGEFEVVTADPFFSAEWSPAGDQIVFLSDGEWQRDTQIGKENMWRINLVDVDAEGRLSNWRSDGAVGYFAACLSAEPTEVDKLSAVQQEAYSLAWSAEDILLHSSSCSGGIGRYDLTEKKELSPYSLPIHKLAMHEDRDRWVGIVKSSSGEDRLALGRASTPTIQTFAPEAAPLEITFGGDDSLLYSTTDVISENDYATSYSEPVSVSLKVTLAHSYIYRLTIEDRRSELVWDSAELTPTRLTYKAGQLWFVGIEQPTALQQAILDQKPANRLQNFLPNALVYRVIEELDSAEIWRERAHLFTFAPNR